MLLISLYYIIMWLKTSKWTSWVRGSKLSFFYFVNSALSAHFWRKKFKSDIAFLRHSNFTDVVTDQWKICFDKKATLKACESGQSIGIDSSSKAHQATNKVSIEDSKICGISKSTLGSYFEIFWLCTFITQHFVFRQLYLLICWGTYFFNIYTCPGTFWICINSKQLNLLTE